MKQPKCREALIEYAGKARLSARLVKLDDNVPLDEGIPGFAVRDPDPAKLLPFLRSLEFISLLRRAGAKLGVDEAELGPLPTPASAAGRPAPALPAESKGCPGAVSERASILKPIDYNGYASVTSAQELDRVIASAWDAGILSVCVQTDSGDAMRARIIGLALAVTPGSGCYIPLSAGISGELDLAKPDAPRLDEQSTLSRLAPVLQDDAVLKIAHNVKFLHALLGKRGIRMRGVDDPMLMSYVLDLGKSAHGLDELSELHLQHKPVGLSDLIGKGRDRIPLETVALPQATRFAAERADIALRLNMLLKPRLIAERRMTVYETLERPLIPVIAEMEVAGIVIAPSALAKLSNDFAREMERLEQECCTLAGEPFNLGSPKQLGDILFGKFSLPGGRRTRTGAWSNGCRCSGRTRRRGP